MIDSAQDANKTGQIFGRYVWVATIIYREGWGWGVLAYTGRSLVINVPYPSKAILKSIPVSSLLNRVLKLEIFVEKYNPPVCFLLPGL
jgi:hypothetical protein